jgi:hypothetical protein
MALVFRTFEAGHYDGDAGVRSTGTDSSPYRAVSPPSMTNSAPVTKADSSDSR